MPDNEIVPPEPHSTGPDSRAAWSHLPHWLQIVLLFAFIVGGILLAIPSKDNRLSMVGNLLKFNGRHRSVSDHSFLT